MKNQKGFSILELVVSFSICLVVAFILLQIVLALKEVYEKSVVKTELLNKHNLIVDQVYTDILEKGLDSVSSCGAYCARFSFNDATTKELQYSSNNLQYGDYVTTLNQGSNVENMVISTENGIASVYLKITHRLFANTDFGIRIVHYIR